MNLLFYDLNKFGFDDAVIKGNQAKTVNAGGRHYRSIGRVLQSSD